MSIRHENENNNNRHRRLQTPADGRWQRGEPHPAAAGRWGRAGPGAGPGRRALPAAGAQDTAGQGPSPPGRRPRSPPPRASPARRCLLPRDLPSAPGKAMLGQGRAPPPALPPAGKTLSEAAGGGGGGGREEPLPPDAAAPLCRIHPPAGRPGTAVPRRPFPGPLWPPRPPGGGARSPRPRPCRGGQLPPGRQHRGPGRLRSRWGRGQAEGGRWGAGGGKGKRGAAGTG